MNFSFSRIAVDKFNIVHVYIVFEISIGEYKISKINNSFTHIFFFKYTF